MRSASIPGTSVYRGSKWGRRVVDVQDEPSRIVLPPETGEQPSLLSGLSDAPWLNRRRPGSLYSHGIIEYK